MTTVPKQYTTAMLAIAGLFADRTVDNNQLRHSLHELRAQIEAMLESLDDDDRRV